jgi:GNAT superfamily N-acetyltransferase
MDEIRGCSPQEVPAVVNLANRVFRPNSGDMGSDYPLLFNADNSQRLRSAWRDGVPVCHAGYVVRDIWILGAGMRAAMVGAVCTDPGSRSQGLASRVLDDLERMAAEEDKCQLLLVSGDRGLYRRRGCSLAGRFRVFSMPAHSLSAASSTVRRAGPSDALALVRLNQARPVRFERSVDDWLMVLQSGMLMDSPADAWIVEREGQALAYFGMSRAEAGGTVRVQEYGGSTAAVLAGLSEAAGQATTVEILEMPADLELYTLLGSSAVCREIRFPGTVRVLDLPTLCDRIQPLLYERLGDEAASELGLAASDDGLALEWQGQVLEAHRDQIPLMFFGIAPPEPGFTLPDPPLRNVLRDLFPLPLPWYGFDYT